MTGSTASAHACTVTAHPVGPAWAPRLDRLQASCACGAWTAARVVNPATEARAALPAPSERYLRTLHRAHVADVLLADVDALAADMLATAAAWAAAADDRRAARLANPTRVRVS